MYESANSITEATINTYLSNKFGSANHGIIATLPTEAINSLFDSCIDRLMSASLPLDELNRELDRVDRNRKHFLKMYEAIRDSRKLEEAVLNTPNINPDGFRSYWERIAKMLK